MKHNPKFSIKKTDLKKLFSFATSETHFLFNGKFYDQVDGVAMGSPLASILANLFLGFHEETWLNNLNKADISYWVTNSHVDSVTPNSCDIILSCKPAPTRGNKKTAVTGGKGSQSL